MFGGIIDDQGADQRFIGTVHLELIGGKDGLHREIVTSDISRPGMEMAGYFKYYPKERLQLMGRTELSFLIDLPNNEMRQLMDNLCTDVTPGIVITRGQDVPQGLIDVADEAGVPLMRSLHKTTRVISRLTNYLETRFASDNGCPWCISGCVRCRCLDYRKKRDR